MNILAKGRKICCVGFQRTGTTSLTHAFQLLGYQVGQAHSELNQVLDPNAADADAVVKAVTLKVLDTCDVIQDSPGPFMFEAMDRAFPGSKFILTYRPVESWLRSYSRFFGDENKALREWMYRVPRFSGNEDTYRNVYETQNSKIRRYFQHRPADFLELELAKGDGWCELVAFLGSEMLPPFPHVNASTGDDRAAISTGQKLRLAVKNSLHGLADRL